MGVDQGAQLHVEIDAWHYMGHSPDINISHKPKVLEVIVLEEFEELDRLMRKWQVRACVIDAHPEKRKALEFASRFDGFVMLCIYGDNTRSKNITVWSGEPTFTADRTAWLDLSLG